MSVALDPRDNWRQQAASLIASGMPVREAARTVGKAEYTVKWALDINNERDKHRERVRRQRLKRRGETKTHPRVEARPNRIEQLDAQIAAHAYCKPPPVGKAKPTLPAISLPMLACEPAKKLRIVTAVAPVSNAGAERWRSIHRAMIRAGRVPEPGVNSLVSEFRQ